jgi:hypothetical protein
VRYVDVAPDQLYGEFNGPETVADRRVVKFRVPLPAGAGNWSTIQWLLEHANGAGVGVADNGPNFVVNILVPLIPWLLIFGFIWFFVFRQLRKQSGGSAGEVKPWPVYIVTSPDPIKPGAHPPTATAVMPAPPLPPLPQQPDVPAPGGDN